MNFSGLGTFIYCVTENQYSFTSLSDTGENLCAEYLMDYRLVIIYQCLQHFFRLQCLRTFCLLFGFLAAKESQMSENYLVKKLNKNHQIKTYLAVYNEIIF
jgi:hypothetical protein